MRRQHVFGGVGLEVTCAALLTQTQEILESLKFKIE
jgi:hypothetical protein